MTITRKSHAASGSLQSVRIHGPAPGIRADSISMSSEDLGADQEIIPCRAKSQAGHKCNNKEDCL